MYCFTLLMNLEIPKALERNILAAIRCFKDIGKTAPAYGFLATIVNPDDTEVRRQYSAVFRKFDKKPVSVVSRPLAIIIQWKTLLVDNLKTFHETYVLIHRRYPHCVSGSRSAQHHCLAAVTLPSCLSYNSIHLVTCERCLLRLHRERYEFYHHHGTLRWMTTNKLSAFGKRNRRVAEQTIISCVLYCELSTKFKTVLLVDICFKQTCKIFE
jgi:hypothetical protein